MNKFPFFKSLLVAFSFIFIISCDKDYNEIGANIIGDDNFVFEKYDGASVKCYNQFDAAVQSNNLPLNMLGVNELAGFGTSTASFVTELELALIDSKLPVIPATATIVEVVLSVPYKSNLKDGSTNTYNLDSIYGNGKIKLSVYENSKYIEDLDGFTALPKKYYSDQFNDFNLSVIGTRLNDSSTSISENDEFFFSASQQTEVEIDSKTGIPTLVDENGIKVEKTIPVSPRMKLQLNIAHFQNKLVGTIPATKMLTNAIFKEYFRGLFFKVEQFGSEKAMAQLDFSMGKIVIFYKENAADTTRKTITLKLSGRTVNLFQNQFNSALPTNESPTLATTNLYLKGGSGFHSYIDLFGAAEDGVVPLNSSERLEIKNSNWIINEANLIFTSSSATSFADSPNRIYLYDAKNKRPILDYYTDSFVNSSKPKYGKTTYGGTKYVENGLTKYKIRITNHLKNIINKDSTNVRLGLVVTEDINTVTNLFIKNAPTDKYYNRVPVSSVINPLGTILYGSDASVDDSKRIKLEIFYTKPN
jgi:Domain of unknown function (DUF4270)